MEPAKTIENCPKTMQTSELNELFTALSKAQAEMAEAALSSVNPFFKSRYTDLTEMVRASRPALVKYGLSVTQPIITLEGIIYLQSILGHSSGQYISSTVIINPDKADIQSLGRYISYLRRYCYASLVGIVSGEDDDGESLMNRQNLSDTLSSDQIALITEESKGDRELIQKICKAHNVQELAHIKKINFLSIIKRVREIKTDGK